jgi:hypothetical protein
VRKRVEERLGPWDQTVMSFLHALLTRAYTEHTPESAFRFSARDHKSENEQALTTVLEDTA